MTELSKTYSSKDAESKWYKIWEEGKYFRPRKGKVDDSFCIIMPPPNVTGQLHMGHALDITTQDALIRFKRMKGYETLFLPGMDHAGISTQAVVEKKVWKEEKKSRHDFTRQEFLDKIWKWKEEYGGIIEHQQRSMGASPDWDYFMFTMDPESHEAVNKCFVRLYNEGLIYRDNRLVNWDPVLQSAISDAEVEFEDVQGNFYHIHYKVKDSDEVLEVATTRPETMLGDTAVAVHPEDTRWKHLIGKTAIVPICDREVPIIADDYVDLEKGTGCLKVTPGHDFNDFEIGKRHNLPVINILNLDGTLNHEGLEWEGEKCDKARKKICARLEELGLLVDVKKHVHSVGHGERSKQIIEPMLSKQWFLNTTEMAAQAVKMVENDTTTFYPKSWENTYFSYLRNPRDWCLSRQLWWGHQIPVYYCENDHTFASETIPEECPECKITKFTQDPDVLDTWFSSGLWPLTTLGWPNKERMKQKGFDTFYPTSVLVTGYDIIFFWVARMMMMGLTEVNKVPFDKVYIHAIVRDKQGRKMSKSLGNGIDPLEVVEEFGADALRFTLAAGSGYNRNLNLDPEKIAGYRNFINKIWNAFRFIQPFLEEGEATLPKDLDHHEKWILSQLNQTAASLNDSMEDFRFDDACSDVYSFVYDKYCSWFIELSKNILHGEDATAKSNRISVLKYCFKKLVALLHPFAPYITEELWSHLKNEDEDLLIVTDFPEYQENLDFPEDLEKMDKFIEVVTKIRNLRSSVNISPKEVVDVHLFLSDDNLREYFENSKSSFSEIGKVKELHIGGEKPAKSIFAATTHTEVFLPLEGVIDIGDQIKRIKKDIEKTDKEYQKVKKKLDSEKFMGSAPAEVIAGVKEKAEGFEKKLESLKDNLTMFEG
jgi:valyl-tRNA synthetase